MSFMDKIKFWKKPEDESFSSGGQGFSGGGQGGFDQGGGGLEADPYSGSAYGQQGPYPGYSQSPSYGGGQGAFDQNMPGLGSGYPGMPQSPAAFGGGQQYASSNQYPSPVGLRPASSYPTEAPVRSEPLSSDRSMDLLISKLDAIRMVLESINTRLQNMERMSQEHDVKDSRRW